MPPVSKFYLIVNPLLLTLRVYTGGGGSSWGNHQDIFHKILLQCTKLIRILFETSRSQRHCSWVCECKIVLVKSYWSEFSRGNSSFLPHTALHNAMNLKFWPVCHFTNEADCATSLFNFLDPWNIGFWSLKWSQVTWHSHWHQELLWFINVHLCWKVRVPQFEKCVGIWGFSSPYFPALQRKSLYSVWMRQNMNQKISEYGHFLRSA